MIRMLFVGICSKHRHIKHAEMYYIAQKSAQNDPEV